jgi:DNA-binding response OmpR family regulator
MSSEEPEAKEKGSRLGGARADFVASLGRKVADARDVLGALEVEPSAAHPRDELRRKLHALGAGARLLRFDAMARSLQEAGAVLERSAQAGVMREPDIGFLAQVLDDLPALAWGEAPPRERAAPTSDEPSGVEGPSVIGHPLPASVLVIGAEMIAEALSDDDSRGGRSFECERTEDAQHAIELARAYAPDICVIDAEVPDAPELVEALLDDPLTEPVPIVVLGTFASPEQAARFVALGVAKALPKPVPAETLRRVCEEILDQREGRTMRMTLGEPTLEALGNRLAEEVRRALVESVDRPARSCRVPLGEGTEVLGAIWGAIARVQEVITTRTGGTIRFGGDAPEGAIAMAPWLHHDLPGADRMSGRGRGAASDVRLERRRVVVADDDPGVTWFIADLLRTAGCEVFEALDGRTALDIALRVSPELVVSDILMPGLDGFALCRALKRDVALRDTPVILLSWKEDLLQRVRELGASAAAYLKKESDSRAIVARVREVLRPRARIEARLKGEDEVRGRLDGITVRLLLELACALRRNARISVRDASFLYEVEARDGAPVRATRTASDGGYQRGERVLASMLGVGAGRFVVSPSNEPIKGELHGTLQEQLARPIACARGALWATTGERSMHVDRIVLDEMALDDYLRATPEPAREIIRRIAKGASPRKMLLGGDIAPSLLEDVLADLAARGAITVVRDETGADLLTPAVEAAYAIIQGKTNERAQSGRPPPARITSSTLVAVKPRSVPPVSDAIAKEITSSYESLTMSEPPPSHPRTETEEATPSSLEDAVMREISERSDRPEPHVTSDPPPLVEPSALRPRSSNPPGLPEQREDALSRDEPLLPSLPPDAIVPGASSSDEMLAVPPIALLHEPNGSGDVDATEVDARVAPNDDGARAKDEGDDEAEAPPAKSATIERTPLASVAARAEPTIPKKRVPWRAFVLLGIVGVVAGFLLRQSTPSRPPSAATDTPTKTSTLPEAPPSVVAPPRPPGSIGDIPSGIVVPTGKGLVEVKTPGDEQVRVDGEVRGRGPAFSTPLAAGAHEIRVVIAGTERRRVVEVEASKSTRIDLTSAP